MSINKKTGFTLSEVLITLVLIGIISVLTIPNLISRINEKMTVYKFLKTYEAIYGAYRLAVMKEGPIENWYSVSDSLEQRNLKFYTKMKKYLKNTKTCEEAGDYCLGNTMLKSLDGTDYANYDNHNEPRLVLPNGTVVWFMIIGGRLKGNIKFDLDGAKGANAWGRDTFLFFIKNNNTMTTDAEGLYWGNDCSVNIHNGNNGIGCGHWIFKHKNMNYLHCDVDDAHPECH